MGILQIKLFGGVRLSHNDWITEVILTREIQILLAYLLLHRHRFHSRDVIAGVFWGDQSQERSRGSLNTALWKLRKVLEPEGISAGTYLKNSYPGEVGFNRKSPYWLDIEVFERQVNQILMYHFQSVNETHVATLEKTLKLYRGELLEGFYDDWTLWERERLRTLYLKSLIYLMRYYGSHRKHEEAITYGQRILSLEPTREETHCEMMRLYMESGERSLALRQYEICCSTLAENYGIVPMEETQTLYNQILNEGSNSHLIESREQIGVDQVLRQLAETSQTLELAKEQIQQVLNLITKSTERQH